MREPLRVRFVHSTKLHLRDRLRGLKFAVEGSQAPRVQMLEELRPFLPEDIDLQITSFGAATPLSFERWLANQRPAIFILSKNLAYSLGEQKISRLSKKALLVGVDHKDADVSRIDLSLFDFHVASSLTAKRALGRELAEDSAASARHPYCGLLLQAPDARLRKVRVQPQDRLRSAYFGRRENSHIPDQLAKEIQTFQVRFARDMDGILPRMSKFNFHYAVRPENPSTDLRSYKPFTKGFTAAALGANMIVNAGVDDAVDFLTEDYPYLTRGNSTDEVVQTFHYARESFGSPEWERGLKIMDEIRNQLQPAALAANSLK